MNLKKLLNEDDVSYEEILLRGIREVFSGEYLPKVSQVAENIKIQEVVANNDITAYSQSSISGTKTFVNKNVFTSFTPDQKKNTLLHEFIHILQNSRKYLLKSNFPEIKALENNLFSICRIYLTANLNRFLSGGNTQLKTTGKEEIVPYLMTGKVDWSVMKDEGKTKFLAALSSSGIFNLTTQFWKLRLPNNETVETKEKDPNLIDK